MARRGNVLVAVHSGEFSLILSNLRNALRRKKQKSAHETVESLFLTGKKAVGMGVVVAGFLLATPPETVQSAVQSAEPTITDDYSAYSYYYSKSRKVYLDATQEVWTREEIYRSILQCALVDRKTILNNRDQRRVSYFLSIAIGKYIQKHIRLSVRWLYSIRKSNHHNTLSA